MMLDAPLAPTLDADADDRTGLPAQSRLTIIDGDVHPAARSNETCKPFLPARWREHLRDLRLAAQARHELRALSEVGAARAGAMPGRRRRPSGLDLDLIRSQYLDAYGIEYGILGAARRCPARASSTAISRAALATAVNDWQSRMVHQARAALQVSIVVPYEDAEAAAAEIERCADDPALRAGASC